MAAFLVPQQFRNSIFAKHKYTKSMKKVILADDNAPHNELYAHVMNSSELCIEIESFLNDTCLSVRLNLEDAKTLRDTIQMCVIQMEQERS